MTFAASFYAAWYFSCPTPLAPARDRAV